MSDLLPEVWSNTRQRPADLSKLTTQQVPDAVGIGCSDSRVPPEVLFDQGDLIEAAAMSNQ